MKSLRLSTLAALACLSASLTAQESVLPYLPKQTIVAISAPDLVKSMQEFAKMPLAKMWAEEETKNFLADVMELGKKKFGEMMAQGREMHAQGALPVNPDELMKLEMHGGTFALTHAEVKMGDFGPMPKFGIVLHLDFGASAPQWHSLVALGLSMMESAPGPKMTKSESKAGEWQIRSFAPDDAKGSEMGLHVAMIPGGLLVGTLLEDVSGIAQNMQKKTAALGASDDYVALTKRLAADGAEMVSFVRLDPIVDLLMQVLQLAATERPEMKAVDMAGIERALQVMGWRTLGCMGSTSNYVDGKAVQRECHIRPGAPAKTAAVKAIDTSFLKWVPKDAVGFAASTMDIAGAYDTLVKGLQAYDPEFATQALGHLAEMEKQFGFSVRDDLIGSVGDHYIRWSMPMGTITAAPEAALLLKVNDEAKLIKSLENLAKLTNGMVEIEAAEKRGLKTWQIRVNFDPTQGMGGMNFLEMFSPTFAFKGGYLVGGFSSNDVKRVFQRMDREDDPKNDIRGNKEFAAVASSIPTGVSSLSFTDWKAEFESYYQIATGLLAFVPIGEEIPIDMSLLPDSGALTKHLFGSVSYSKEDGALSETVSTSPFGMEIGLLVALVVGGAAAFGIANQGHF